MDVLIHDDDRKIHAHSSIDQFSKFIATYERGGWTPISFDYLDYVDCDKPATHKVIIEFDDKLGYYFPIDECEFETDEYILPETSGVVLRELPKCMGEGFFQAYDKSDLIINFDNGSALGTHNRYKLKIGTDYLLAEDFLPADDAQ